MERRFFLLSGLFLHLLLPMLFDDPRQPRRPSRRPRRACAPERLADESEEPGERCGPMSELEPVPVPQLAERYSTAVSYERLPGRPAAMYVRSGESGVIRCDRRLVVIGVDDGPGIYYSDVNSHCELLQRFMLKHAEQHLETEEGLACRDGATCPQCREMRALLAWFLDDDSYLA